MAAPLGSSLGTLMRFPVASSFCTFNRDCWVCAIVRCASPLRRLLLTRASFFRCTSLLMSDDFPTFDPRIQKELDPVRHRIKPRTIVNMAAGVDLFRESHYPVSLQFGINNLFDRFYLYNFHSIFSGTHVGRPREAVIRLTFHWKAK